MGEATELGKFLRSRRERLTPAIAGFEDDGPRRVPGLRREELAHLAGLSVDYYTRLEQGRSTRPSQLVLDSLARALMLDEAEAAHLRRVAKPRANRDPQPSPPARVRQSVRRLLESLEDSAALVLDRNLDVIAHTPLGAALFCEWQARPKRERNLARFVFLDPDAKQLYANWTQAGGDVVGALRLAAGRWPDDERIAAVIGDLMVKSEAFHQLWRRNDVHLKASGRKRLRHPMVGPIDLDFNAMELLGEEGVALIVYSPRPASKSAMALLSTSLA